MAATTSSAALASVGAVLRRNAVARMLRGSGPGAYCAREPVRVVTRAGHGHVPGARPAGHDRGCGVGGIAGLIVTVIVIVIAVIVASRVVSGMHPSPRGPCVGGPVQWAAGHGNYRLQCSGGGSTVVHFGNGTQ